MLLISVVKCIWIRSVPLLLLGIFILSACNKNFSNQDSESELESQIMEKGAEFLEMRNYNQANKIYSQFIAKFPDHPYVDDAAYRLAYICVIADDKNPYFNNEKAQDQFQNFIENYPNSRYISPSRNWLSILQRITVNNDEESQISSKNSLESDEINQLRNELLRLQGENSRLKKTLEELQKAIER